MQDANQHPSPNLPQGLNRFLYRLPIFFYSVGLGPLLGKRFLLLEHIGRRSGLKRKAVLEVIRHDRRNGIYYVVSAFGDRSDWVRNVILSPAVTITVGCKRMHARAGPLSEEESAKEIIDYARKYPAVFQFLTTRLLGFAAPKSEAEVRQIARKLIVVSFVTTRFTEDNQR